MASLKALRLERFDFREMGNAAVILQEWFESDTQSFHDLRLAKHEHVSIRTSPLKSMAPDTELCGTLPVTWLITF